MPKHVFDTQNPKVELFAERAIERAKRAKASGASFGKICTQERENCTMFGEFDQFGLARKLAWTILFSPSDWFKDFKHLSCFALFGVR